MRVLIKNGRVVDPANNRDEICDILVADGRIAEVGRRITARAGRVIEAEGKIVIPGLVDMHAHLREPGREDEETIATGTNAALKGGITTMAAMPNTEPAIDSVAHCRLLRDIIRRSARADVLVCASITKERAGRELVDIGGLKKEGVVAISDDGSSVESEALMEQALREAAAQGVRVLCHCEDKKLAAGGSVNLGVTSTRMGLRGISAESEYVRIEREIRLAEKSRTAVHIQHVSCRGSVEVIARAKKRGVPVTAETAPHYFSLSEESVRGFDTNMKMNPPLRSRDDVAAVIEGLKSAVIDAIASDHAPHTENDKEIEFERAAFGVIGLETSLAAGITGLIDPRVLTWSGLVQRMSLNPSRILGIPKGTLGAGSCADIVVVDPSAQWLVRKEDFVSLSKNSCFLGRTLKGRVEYTIRAGVIAYVRCGNPG